MISSRFFVPIVGKPVWCHWASPASDRRAQSNTCLRDRLIDSRLAPVNDHDCSAVTSTQTAHDPLSQVDAVPVSIAHDKDTHVQIRTNRKHVRHSRSQRFRLSADG